VTYTPNIPVTGDSLGSTRDRINTNFQQIYNVFEENHYPFNSANQGKHMWSSYPEQSSDPSTEANELAIYAKPGLYPVETDLFLRAESNGFVYAMTRVNSAFISTMGQFITAGTVTTNYSQIGGWTFLPGGTNGGLLFQYATVLSTLSTPQISPSTILVTYPVPFQNSNVVVTITAIDKAGGSAVAHTASLRAGTVTNLGFTCDFDTSTSAYVGFTWTAIGL